VLKSPISELKRSKYRVLGLIGQGQFGRVYCAVHHKTGRLVALKSLDHQRFPTHKFLRELRFLLSLQHPNIVTCQALEHTRNGRCLVMDYCEGGTLRHLMEGESGLTLAQGLRLVMELLAGLAHAHDRNIIHCDIKPENILLNINAQGWTARISDFGIARLGQSLGQESSTSTGSPAYMAPERFYGQYFPSSDLYAIGVLLFELLVGDRPFSGVPADLMSAHLNRPVVLPAMIPAPLQPVILRALQKLPARRFHSATEMLLALEQAIVTLEATQQTLPLGQPSLTLSSCSLTNCQSQPLTVPIDHLAASSLQSTTAENHQSALFPRIYRASKTQQGSQIELGQSYGTSNTDPYLLTQLTEPLQELAIRPPGCFAITPRSIYLLPLDPMTDPGTIVHLDTDSIAALDPTGHWFATCSIYSNPAQFSPVSTLNCWHWTQPRSLAQLSSTRSLPTVSTASKLYFLDSRHLVLISKLEPGSSHTLFEFFTRRGNAIGVWKLPVPLQHLTPSTVPYRFLAVDQQHPTSILLIDMKPFRITRVSVPIAPKLVTAASWGYVLADAQGQIILINELGQQVGWIDRPLTKSGSTTLAIAIVAQHPHNLFLSTWDHAQGNGNLYTVDLSQLEIDLLF